MSIRQFDALSDQARFDDSYVAAGTAAIGRDVAGMRFCSDCG
jgi:hypothetical protein